jgi:hypothetical protein
MSQIKGFLQHHFNPLHVYCKLRKLGVVTPVAQRVCNYYERYFYRLWLG